MRSASTPGSLLPSISSSAAPPPVEMWLTPFTTSGPACFTAAALSPPPTTVKPGAAATIRARSIVPREKAGVSKRPMGPFQNTVFARVTAAPKSSTVFGPTSRAMVPSGTRSTEVVSPVVASRPEATTTSTGRSTSTPLSRARARMVRARGSLSSSIRLFAMSFPCAARNVLAIAPPTARVSTTPSSASTTSILSETFAPPSTATYGFSGRSTRRERLVSSFWRSRPAALRRTSSGRAWTEAWARCTAPNASST